MRHIANFGDDNFNFKNKLLNLLYKFTRQTLLNFADRTIAIYDTRCKLTYIEHVLVWICCKIVNPGDKTYKINLSKNYVVLVNFDLNLIIEWVVVSRRWLRKKNASETNIR